MGGQDVINAGVSSADTHGGIYGSSSAPVEFTVTVGTKTGTSIMQVVLQVVVHTL